MISDSGHIANVSVTTIVRDASLFGGGMANVARPLHSALLAQGRDVAFVCGTGVADANSASHVVGLTGSAFRELPASVMRSVVHIHGIWTPFEYQAFREARRRCASIVMSPHGALERWAFDHKPVKKRFAWWLYQKRLLQSADLIVVNSEQERQRLRELGLKPPIATIPNGVDLDGFSAPNGAQQRERVVLFLSRIDPKKGVLDLIDAWRSLAGHHGHRLHILGHGDPAYVERIRKKIGESGCNDISLLPPIFGPARWDVFTRASIYVLPSYSENFGITIAEALTAGLPVITTRATPWECLVHEGLGWIVDNDVSQLRDALAAAIRLEPSKLEDLRPKAQTYASQHFGWAAIAQRYAETYDWISNPSGAAPAFVDLG